MPRQVIVEAPAKTNLFLAVGDARKDGYHDVRTILCPLDFHDEITLSAFGPKAMSSTLSAKGGPKMPPDKNMVMQALYAMQKAFGRNDQFAISLTKNIPVGAGLGGGSSDAAAVIAGVARIWDIDPGDERLTHVAASLGADVPFFLHGGATYMDGRGDHFVRSYEMPTIDVALVKPSAPIPTRKAYLRLDHLKTQGDGPVVSAEEEASYLTDLTAALEKGDVEDIASSIYNNMEPAALNIVPKIAGILEYAQDTPGIYRAFVSGSGSAVAILCKGKGAASAVCERARRDGHWSMATVTRNEGVIVREGR